MIQIFDGAMGTMLQNGGGLDAGDCPERLNIDCPETVMSVHLAYISNGATIIETNTFGANRIKLSHYGLEDLTAALNKAAVAIAKSAAGSQAKVAGSVGSTGKFIRPLGELTFDEAYNVFFEQISALDEAGVDFILIETIIDIQEMRAALLAAKDASQKPVICQMSFGEDGRTVTGTDALTAAITLEAMGANIIGANCSLGPAQLLPIVETFAKHTSCPISVQPNAGMPYLQDGETVFPMSAEEMAEWAPKLVAAGATYIGGCCGTTPAHIAAIASAVKDLSPSVRPAMRRKLALTSRSKTVFVDQKLPTILIGERINPTGRKKLAADIREGNFVSVKKEALEQTKAGAQLLDVNMGVAGIEQCVAMETAIREISQLIDTPLAIDTSDAAALEAGLKEYPGRALINSVSAESDRLRTFLPLAKRYGAAILCLPITDEGVPKTADERLDAIKIILETAAKHGLKAGDFLLDALVMTIAADETACQETLRTLQLYRKHFGYPSTMGLSNISFGLPNRAVINSNFFAMCLACGLDAPIMNPYDPSMKDTLAAAAALLGHDKNGHAFSMAAAAKQSAGETPSSTISTSSSEDPITAIRVAILNGEKEAVAPFVLEAIARGMTASDITDRGMTAAMEEIGKKFSTGKLFLPQVLLSAETMRAAFETVKEALPLQPLQSRGKVVLATVKGDIHDLGKNIVAALLENNGFSVLDLGKDIDCETIVKAAIRENADLVGLCALMTTTMPQIDATILALKQSGSLAKVMVGGAVLTQEYANQAGADCYAHDGVAAVSLAKELIGQN